MGEGMAASTMPRHQETLSFSTETLGTDSLKHLVEYIAAACLSIMFLASALEDRKAHKTYGTIINLVAFILWNPLLQLFPDIFPTILQLLPEWVQFQAVQLFRKKFRDSGAQGTETKAGLTVTPCAIQTHRDLLISLQENLNSNVGHFSFLKYVPIETGSAIGAEERIKNNNFSYPISAGDIQNGNKAGSDFRLFRSAGNGTKAMQRGPILEKMLVQCSHKKQDVAQSVDLLEQQVRQEVDIQVERARALQADLEIQLGLQDRIQGRQDIQAVSQLKLQDRMAEPQGHQDTLPQSQEHQDMELELQEHQDTLPQSQEHQVGPQEHQVGPQEHQEMELELQGPQGRGQVLQDMELELQGPQGRGQVLQDRGIGLQEFQAQPQEQ
ncbi:hypothetical protein L345_00936, partial [Ophiophagus hannah]